MYRYLEKVARKIFVRDKWNIGIAHCSCRALLDGAALNEVHWLPEADVDYRADPFVVRYADELNCFYEEYDWASNCGVLKCLRLDQTESDPVTVHLEGLEGCHLSYPYVFLHNDHVYLVPESYERKEIMVYRASRFPTEWRKVTTIAKGDEFVDNSLLYDGEIYWVISSVSGRDGLIHVFFSQSIETGWSPHLLNPIPVERNGTRGAGRIFCQDGTWYRPTQVLDGGYGGAIQINRIHISVTSFKQCAAFNLWPIKPYTDGIHNIDIDVSSGIIVIDGKQYVRSLYTPLAKASGRVRKHNRLRNQRDGI